jgi:hypothetical protein
LPPTMGDDPYRQFGRYWLARLTSPTVCHQNLSV